MAKFTKPPLQTFEPEAAAEAETTTLDSVMGFVENDMLYIIMISVIVIFLAIQFGRWALSTDSGEVDAEDAGEEDRRLR